jgi:uncharacterized HAD superfamily protein
MVILVDVDGTLCRETCWTPHQCSTATPRPEVIERVNKLYERHFICIYTARRDYLIPATLEWLNRVGVRYHSISNFKVPCEVLIDDRAMNVEDFIQDRPLPE